ncbi:Holliday junction branch migration protein RuvA [Patescibacteria group bacterium]
MIEKIKGNLEYKKSTHAVIDVHGVGYRVNMTPTALANLKPDSDVEVITYLYVAEGVMELYGFQSADELEIFEMLIGVSGIGPKSALGVLAVASVDDISAAVATQDTSLLTKVSGVGEKTAQRIIVDLKDKLEKADLSKTKTKDGVAQNGEAGAQAEAVDALIGLGYTAKDARDAIKSVEGREKMDVGEIIRAALRQGGR